MSAEAMKWARRQKLGIPSLNRLADALAALVNEKHNGCLYHSQRSIAERARYGTRTVRRLLADLETLGVIQRARRSRGQGRGRTTDLIRLRLDQDFTFTKDEATALLQAAKMASCNAVQPESYKRPSCHLQAAKMAGDDKLCDQPKSRTVNPREHGVVVVGTTHVGARLAVVNGGRA